MLRLLGQERACLKRNCFNHDRHQRSKWHQLVLQALDEATAWQPWIFSNLRTVAMLYEVVTYAVQLETYLKEAETE